jgi:hypothetical protein
MTSARSLDMAQTETPLSEVWKIRLYVVSLDLRPKRE